MDPLKKFPIKQILPSDFPSSLFEIPTPPKTLNIRGFLPSKDLKHLCVIGSRKYSIYGKEVCEKLITGLQGYPVVIVSGLALGIDTIAHEAALKVKIPTIAVPGSGLSEDVLYPRSNMSLAQNILKNGGCLISEFENNFKATQYSFPQRNRIMAGLSQAILVIEAEEKSGTLITARLATDYNKDVLTVPGDIWRETSKGPSMLLKLGATPITRSEDILEALHIEVKEEERQLRLADLSPDEEKLARILTNPLSKDEIILETNWSSQKVAEIVTILEIKGVIKESYGKVFLA